MTSTIKILVSEDHDLYREGVCLLLEEMERDFHILQADNFTSTRALIKKNPDLSLLLLDIQMPGTQGLDGLKELRQHYPFLPIVVVSQLEMGMNVRNVMNLGANGFIAKSTSKYDFQQALERVLNGEIVIITADKDEENIRFSPRHLETLKLLTEGKSNKEIAKILDITPTTVRQYISEIMQKLQVDNRVKAALEAKRRGIIID